MMTMGKDVTVTPTPEQDAHFTTADEDDQRRFRVYRLCICPACGGRGRGRAPEKPSFRCENCRGEGRIRERVATADTEGGVGVAICTLAREGEFEDCPIGILDTQGETGKKWLILPWQPSPRNVSDAARVMAKSRAKK